MVGFDFPDRGEDYGGVGGEGGVFEVDLVLERDLRAGQLGEVEGVFAGSGRYLRDEGWVGGYLFEDREVFEADRVAVGILVVFVIY